METVTDEYRLEDIAEQHEVAAGIFVPFAILRLLGDPSTTEATLTMKLRNIGQAGETQRALRLKWSAESILAQSLAVQENTITEWAALGVACAVISLYAGLRVKAVARQGDCFDYWVTDSEHVYGLEVSGTMTEVIEARHRLKLGQLRANPYRVGGYVVAVSFATRTVILSCNEFEETGK